MKKILGIDLAKIFTIFALAFTCIGVISICSSCSSEQASMAKLTESVQKSLDDQDYESAYQKVDAVVYDDDHPDLRATGYSLNEKILTQEIISLIETDENGNSAPKIVYAISERAKYNGYMSLYNYNSNREYAQKEEKKMYKLAIKMSKAMENEQLTKKLEKALKDL